MCQSFAARSLCIAGLLALIAATAPIAWSAEEMRTWSDATGKHKVEAKFKEVADGKVTLVRQEGGLMEMALTKLSADDQAYVAKRVAEAEDDPFKLKSDEAAPAADEEMENDDDADADKSGKSAGGRGKGKSSSKKITTVQPDWSKAENIPHAASAETWKLSVPAAPADGPHLKARTIPTLPGVDQEHPTETVISPSASHALVGSAVGAHGGGHRMVRRHSHRSETTVDGVTTQNQETSVETNGSGGNRSDEAGMTRLALCDLAKGKVIDAGTMAGKYIPLAVDDGGTRALMREDKFGFDVKALELWDLTSSGPKLATRRDDRVQIGRRDEWPVLPAGSQIRSRSLRVEAELVFASMPGCPRHRLPGGCACRPWFRRRSPPPWPGRRARAWSCPLRRTGSRHFHWSLPTSPDFG